MPVSSKQSSPPSPFDVHRGLPMGPGGILPLLFDDRRWAQSRPKLLALIHQLWRRSMSSRRSLKGQHDPAMAECCP